LFFFILDKQTELTLSTIDREERTLEMEVILDNLSSPISDMIVIKSLMLRVEKTKIDSQLKKQIVGKLKATESKSN